MNIDDEDRLPWLRAEKRWLQRIVEDRKPTLGICLGAQLLAEASGAAVEAAKQPEIGWRTIDLLPSAGTDPLFKWVDPRPTVFQWHSWSFAPPTGAIPLAVSSGGLQAFRLPPATWEIQFHAEVTPDKLSEWLETATADPEARRLGVDHRQEREASRSHLPGSMHLGRVLCDGS